MKLPIPDEYIELLRKLANGEIQSFKISMEVAKKILKMLGFSLYK